MSVFTQHGLIQGHISSARLKNGVPLNFAAQDPPPQLVAGPHVLVGRGEGNTSLTHEADSIFPLHHGSINSRLDPDWAEGTGLCSPSSSRLFSLSKGSDHGKLRAIESNLDNAKGPDLAADKDEEKWDSVKTCGMLGRLPWFQMKNSADGSRVFPQDGTKTE